MFTIDTTESSTGYMSRSAAIPIRQVWGKSKFVMLRFQIVRLTTGITGESTLSLTCGDPWLTRYMDYFHAFLPQTDWHTMAIPVAFIEA